MINIVKAQGKQIHSDRPAAIVDQNGFMNERRCGSGFKYVRKRSSLWMTGFLLEASSWSGGYSIVKLNRRDPIHPKTFEEARQEVASQYQDDRASELRAEWIKELRTKYDRVVNENLIAAEYKKQNPTAITAPGK